MEIIRVLCACIALLKKRALFAIDVIMDLSSLTAEQIRLLVDARNRVIIDILDEMGGSLHAEELAEQLVSDDVAIVDSSIYEDQLERALISLHHNRLPKLAEVGLVIYDHQTNIVTIRSPQASSERLEDKPLLDALNDYLKSRHEMSDNQVSVVTGREPIIQYGRQLADEAKEELFCMYASPELLEDTCIHHAEQALDRGVQMYMGSQDVQVRDLTRNHLPEAIIWEPQLDALSTQTSIRMGRLVMIDRQKVMLASLNKPAANGAYPEETALIGVGEDHPLVVFVRELLGPRIDHLDYQSETRKNNLRHFG